MIEVKPGAATKGVAWTPLQVAVYVRMLRSWIEPDQEARAAVLEGMARQRATLGLTSASVPKLRLPVEIVPVDRRRQAADVAPGGTAAVRGRFGKRSEIAGEPLEGLTLWAVEQTGALSALDAHDLDDRRFR